MELVYFDWTTNPDYFDLLRRPIIRTEYQIKRAAKKRLRAKLKRQKFNK